MALIGNRSVLLKSPGRYFGGSTVSDNRSNFGTPGSTRGRYFGGFPQINATPSGYRPPYSWIMAIKNGEISSVNLAGISIGSSGAIAGGKNASGTASIVFGLSGTGGLISSASGTASISFSATGGLFASKAVIGTASVSIGANGTIKGIGHMHGSGGISIASTWTPYAIGWISGTTESGGLTPNGIAQAVGERVIEAGITQDQLNRLILAFVAGNATGLEGADPKFYSQDGSTVRIDGSYSAGNRTIDALNVE